MSVTTNSTVGRTFKNQIQLRDGKSRIVTIWHADDVVGFFFHSLVICPHGGKKSDARLVHGVTVDPRHVWNMMDAVYATPSSAIMSNGDRIFVHEVYPTKDQKCLRLGAGGLNYGRVVASQTLQNKWLDDGSSQ